MLCHTEWKMTKKLLQPLPKIREVTVLPYKQLRALIFHLHLVHLYTSVVQCPPLKVLLHQAALVSTSLSSGVSIVSDRNPKEGTTEKIGQYFQEANGSLDKLLRVAVELPYDKKNNYLSC